MEDKTIKVLLIEDNPDDAELIQRKLARSGNGQFTVTPVAKLKEGLEYLARDGADLVLSDLGLPDSHGLDTVTKLLCQAPHTPMVVLSGFDDEAIAIQAVQLGAQDYLVKGQMGSNQLERTLLYAIERSSLQRELEQYTQELGKIQAALCKILEKNADAIIVVGKDRHIRFVNPAAVSLLECKKEDLLDKPFGFPLKGGKTSEIEIIRQGRGTTVAEMRTVDIDWEGEPAYLASLRDITERKQAEAALLESEEFSSSLLQNSPNPIVVINPDTSIKFTNPAFEKLTGFTPAEIVGRRAPYPWWPEESKEERAAALKEVMTGSGNRMERISRQKNGKPFWAVISSAPVIINGTLKFLLVNWVDITERKEAEEKLRQIDHMKSEFLSNVSHELRTPLQSISGFAKLILRGKVSDPETQQEFLQIIDRESQHLGNLINNLLDISRLESGRFEINKRLLPIRDTIIDAVKSFHSLARDKNIVLNEDIPVELPEIEVDGERLRQVVINLIGNAIKFSDPGGSVMVKTGSRNRELLFQVIDQGIGIPEESMTHLFERFYRAEDKMVRGGAGLGLYISKQIIEAHGGHIWAESKVGEGSTFSFTLPLNGKGGDARG